jgi:hypothetical protein
MKNKDIITYKVCKLCLKETVKSNLQSCKKCRVKSSDKEVSKFKACKTKSNKSSNFSTDILNSFQHYIGNNP